MVTLQEVQSQLIAVLQQITELKRDTDLEEMWATASQGAETTTPINGTLSLKDALMVSMSYKSYIRYASPYASIPTYPPIMVTNSKCYTKVWYRGRGHWELQVVNTETFNVTCHHCESYFELMMVMTLDYCIHINYGWVVTLFNYGSW